MHALFLVLALAAPQQQYQETITVSRVLVDLRVTGYDGEPVTGLTPEDLTVKIGGKPATVESLDWIDDTDLPPAVEELDDMASLAAPRRHRGRLFIVFIQTDFARNNFRVVGQMSFTRYAEEFIDSLEPEDRVAVFSFDSHLKFRRDFSNDKEDLKQVIRDAIRIDVPPPPPVVPSPSLAARLDHDKMKKAATSETGLALIANALTSIDGPKSLLLLGWGLGRYSRGGVWMIPEWKAARAALDNARVSIFSLDTAWADFHDLEFGMQTASKETGGFYAKTFHFPKQAIARLQRTLSGHYEMSLRVPAQLKPGTYKLDVRVKRRGIEVLAPANVIAE
ncbi:MAG TPA: VWA domain-containing protein [Thermoanaerobaculia bacterium]|nr:VWA domain-containing protein [Thermoanaerobaculia bacterium]